LEKKRADEPTAIEPAKDDVKPLVSELGPDQPYWNPATVIGTVNMALSRSQAPFKPTEDQLTVKDLEAIEHAIDTLGTSRKEMLIEKEELEDLKEELQEYQEDLQMLEVVQKSDTSEKVKVNKGAQRLHKKLNTMILEMDKLVTGAAKDGPVTKTSVVVATEELIEAMRAMRSMEDDPTKVERIAKLLAKLDDNKDGKIEIDDLVKVIEIVGRDNINMTPKQFEEIVATLAKEEILEGSSKKGPAS